MSGVTSVSTVGSSMPSRTFPPHATVAPPATASSIHDATRSRVAGRDERRHVGGVVERIADHERLDERDELAEQRWPRSTRARTPAASRCTTARRG